MYMRLKHGFFTQSWSIMELVQNFSTNYLSVYYGIVQIFSFKPQTMVIIR